MCAHEHVREIYPVPAQNPKVEPGTLEQDLLRRDFGAIQGGWNHLVDVHAMAIDLMAEQQTAG